MTESASLPALDCNKYLTDASSPYFMHPSNQLNQFLVDTPLNGDNYLAWHRAITRALNAKNKLGFVLGTIKRPIDDTAAALLWDWCYDMIMSWLLHSIDRSLRGNLLYYATPNDLSVELETRFQQSNRIKKFQLKQDLANFHQEQQSVTTYYGKLKELWNELASLQPANPCTYGASKSIAELQETDQVYQFLMDLNESFQQLRSQILATDPLPSIGHCHAMLHQEETQRLVQLTPSQLNASALIARSSMLPTTTSRPHRICSAGTPLCEACGKPGHQQNKCFEIIGYPEWWPSKNKRNTSASSSPAVHQVSAYPQP